MFVDVVSFFSFVSALHHRCCFRYFSTSFSTFQSGLFSVVVAVVHDIDVCLVNAMFVSSVNVAGFGCVCVRLFSLISRG